MHNHSDFKLMSRCITSLERANNIGLHPYAARAPLDGTTSLSPPPSPCLACRLTFVTCFVACGALNFLMRALFSISFLEFCDDTLQVMGI